jgi:hypothetical protein
MRSFQQFVEGIEVLANLKLLYDKDQEERNEYQSYLKSHGDWKQAAAAWSRDKKRSQNDVFDDGQRLQQAKQLIQNNLDQIKSSPEYLKMAWLLVQHMDNDVAFQQWFLQHLKKGTTNHRYLTDRILTNQGLPQKYNTQNL